MLHSMLHSLHSGASLRRCTPVRCASLAMAFRASHILVKYDGSARQASWRDPEGTTIRARTREMAAQTLSDIRAQLQALEGSQRAERFAVLARETSDCGTAREGGDLGALQPGEMMEEFEEAVNHIVVGDLSEVIQTESGTIRLSTIDNFAGLQLSWLELVLVSQVFTLSYAHLSNLLTALCTSS